MPLCEHDVWHDQDTSISSPITPFNHNVGYGQDTSMNIPSLSRETLSLPVDHSLSLDQEMCTPSPPVDHSLSLDQEICTPSPTSKNIPSPQ